LKKLQKKAIKQALIDTQVTRVQVKKYLEKRYTPLMADKIMLAF
jgi:hypothetical protein